MLQKGAIFFQKQCYFALLVKDFCLKSDFIEEKTVTLQRKNTFYLGLTGFDSGLDWYVSTRSVGCLLLNISGQKINWQQ